MSQQPAIPYEIGQLFLQIGTKEVFQLASYELRDTPNGKEIYYLLDSQVPDFFGGFQSLPVTEYSLEKYFAPLDDCA